MNVADAADSTVHDYPGGSESLGPRIGMSPAVLRNKVNPNNDRNVLTLAEAQKIMRVTDDHRILAAQAADLGYALLAVSGDDGDETASLTGMVLKLSTATGDFARVVDAALADGVITPNEMVAIQNMAHADQAALIGLVKRLHTMHARGNAH